MLDVFCSIFLPTVAWNGGEKRYLGDLVCPASEIAVSCLSGLFEITHPCYGKLKDFKCYRRQGGRRGRFWPTVG